jgi:hypothetical protein
VLKGLAAAGQRLRAPASRPPGLPASPRTRPPLPAGQRPHFALPQGSPGAAAPLTFFFRSRERFLRFLLDSSFSFCSWRACASMSLIFFNCLAA